VKRLDGVFIPAVTPFDKDGALRTDLIVKNIQHWNTTDITGIMVLGSNAEFRSLDDDEAFEVAKTASENLAEDKTLIAGIGRESLYGTLKFLKRLEEAKLRIDYVSVLTPGYFKGAMTDKALISYFTAIADASSIPVMLYCAPGFANSVCISPEALKVLADHPNIVGIKDTSKDMMASYMDAVGGREDFIIMAGSLGNAFLCLERGGKAGMLSAANYFPNTCAKFYKVLAEEGLEEAKKYHADLKALAACTGGLAGVAGVKATMNLMGLNGAYPRSPLLPCDEEVLAKIQQGIDEYSEMLKEDRK